MKNKLQNLRAAAEVQPAAITPRNESLQHELQVQQIELQMQNENLRQMQLELSESRDRYLDLYDFAPVAYLTLNRDGLIVEANFTSASLLGLERNLLIGNNFYKYLGKEACKCWYPYFSQALLSPAGCELTLLREDGSALFVHLDGQPKLTGTNESTLRLTLTDLTSLQLKEQAIADIHQKLDESQRLLEAIVENIPAMIFVKRADDLTFELFNRAGEVLLGYKREELLGKGNNAFWPKAQADWFTAADRKVLASGTSLEIPEEAIQAADGKLHYLHTWKVALHDREGAAAHLLGISLDITEHRLTQTLLRESEQKFRSIFEGALDGIVLMEIDSFRFADANPAFCQMIGYTHEALTGKNVLVAQPNGDMDKIRANIERHVCGETQLSSDIPIQCRDGTVNYADIKSSRISLNGRDYLMGIFRIVTERKRIQAELMDSQRLLRQLAAQGAASREAELKHLAREVHDELGQLLTALRMDISLLRIEFGGRDAQLMEKIKGMLVLVDKAIQGARDVTGNLHPPVLELGIVPAIRWLSNVFAARSGFNCDVHVHDEPNGQSDICTLTLFRIVQESLTNIVRYANASQVDISIRKIEDKISIIVQDDGSGFDTGTLLSENSFGLMGMRERALAAGGKVEITSVLGQGTRVQVEIPLIKINPGRRVND